MSAAAATADAAAAAPKKGKKKLIVIVAVLLLVVLGGGGAALFMMKKKAAEAAEAEEGGSGGSAAAHAPSGGHKAPPTFVPLDPFVVNLADRDGERYAQVGLTLEVDDPKFGEEMKGYMPAVRSAILLILAHKTSQQLLTAEGKEALAEEIMREAVRPMGIEIDPPEAEGHDDDHDDAPKKAKPGGKKKKKKHEVHNPVQRVHFASFIIQ